METKAKYLGIETVVGSVKNANLSDGQYCGAVVQYPDTFGEVYDLSDFSKYCHDNGALVIAVTDILASAILKPAGEMGADIAVGSAQRFGVPLVTFPLFISSFTTVRGLVVRMRASWPQRRLMSGRCQEELLVSLVIAEADLLSGYLCKLESNIFEEIKQHQISALPKLYWRMWQLRMVCIMAPRE